MPGKMYRAATVLLAEDNPADQNLTRRALGRGVIECDLRVVSDGAETMDYLLHRGRFTDHESSPRPDLTLLDLNMPKLSGMKVLEGIRADAMLDTIPVVILTTSQHEQDVVRGYKLGCRSFVKKPVEVADFVAALKQLGSYWLKLVVLPPAPREQYRP